MNIRENLKKIYYRIIAAKGEPWQIAGGVAVGLFWGFSPFWGLQMFFAAICATFLNVSRIPAVLLVHISNPLTAPALYPVTWSIGNWLLSPVLPAAASTPEFSGLFSLGGLRELLTVAWGMLLRATIGGMFIGMFAGAIGYFITLAAVKEFHKTLRERRAAGIEDDDPPAAASGCPDINPPGNTDLQNHVHKAS